MAPEARPWFPEKNCQKNITVELGHAWKPLLLNMLHFLYKEYATDSKVKRSEL